MQAIIDYLNSFWQYGVQILQFAMGNVKPLLTHVIQDTFTGLMFVASTAIQAVDCGTLLTKVAAAWGVLDPKIAWFMVNLGVSEGLGILSLAFGIRFLLNLIPAAFTRV